jgi:hypothetical protein
MARCHFVFLVTVRRMARRERMGHMEVVGVEVAVVEEAVADVIRSEGQAEVVGEVDVVVLVPLADSLVLGRLVYHNILLSSCDIYFQIQIQVMTKADILVG